MKNKNGSHVGLVLSFVIFVTFLFFIFTVLNPAVKQEKSKQLILDIFKENLMSEINSKLSVTSLKVKSDVTFVKNCFDINNLEGMILENVKVFDETGSLVGFSNTENEKIRINSVNKFFKIYYSNEFIKKSDLEPCDQLDIGEYTIGATRTTEYVFKGKLDEILSKYDSDYEGLKQDLGISLEYDFGIGFVDSEGNVNEKGFAPVSGNVYVEDIPVQYYTIEGNIKSGIIKIRAY